MYAKCAGVSRAAAVSTAGGSVHNSTSRIYGSPRMTPPKSLLTMRIGIDEPLTRATMGTSNSPIRKYLPMDLISTYKLLCRQILTKDVVPCNPDL
jgi:hypothetical protein